MNYPLFLKLEGKRVLVVGGGPVGLEKAAKLASAGALVRLIDPRARTSNTVREARAGEFEDSDLDDVWLVIAAAPPAVNRRVREAADARQLFTIAIDDVASCTAYGAATFERGVVTIALSSDGRAPALVSLLRSALESLIPSEDASLWSAIASAAREEWRARGVPMQARKPALLAAMNAIYEGGGR